MSVQCEEWSVELASLRISFLLDCGLVTEGRAFSRSEVTFLSRSDVFGSVHCFGSHIPSRLPFAQQICAAATGSRTNSLRSGLCRNTLTLLTAELPPSRYPSRRCPFSATVANVMQIKSKA